MIVRVHRTGRFRDGAHGKEYDRCQHALEHPGQTLKEMARALGVSKSTVHAILKDIDFSTPSQRWEWLERLARRRSEKWQPSEEQLRFPTSMNQPGLA